jgi:hypothetical protein
MPLILGAQSATADAGYQIEKSCRFNNPDSPSMSYAIGSDGSLVACTINVWFKSNGRGVACPILQQYVSGTSAKLYVGGVAAVSSNIQFYSNRTGESPAEPDRITTAQYGDPAAWYNIHCVFDSANGVAEDRMRVYVNGTRVTAWDTNLDPQLNANWGMFNYTDGARTLSIGTKPYGSAAFLAGYLANLIVCDGQTYDPDKFGEFDEDSPTVWRPIDPAEQSLTFGTHGFWLDFADSAALGNDVSGENNDFTPSNLVAADQATDTPTNNFSTLNPLQYMGGSSPTFSEGACQYVQGGSSQYYPSAGTMGLTSGKWYWEVQTTDGAKNGALHGIAGDSTIATNYVGTNNVLGFTADQWAISAVASGYRNNNAYTTYGVGFYGNVIVGVYLDLDNNKLYFASGGTIMESGTGIDITAASSTDSGYYVPGSSYWGGDDTFQYNFGGCSAFAVTSAQQDVNGYGNFEYSPNDGGSASFDGSAKDFLAICTKNLGSSGG